ncbi:MAG: acetate--CoA ligase family protein [Candidatus Lokiarchaeota archaeon]|nr:acetate--CoA ligase family protein [Candidatus Lokiarchaeota archaeon]
MKRKLSFFLKPKSIAVIGASESPGKVGNSVFHNIISTFKGNVYPINPTKDEICGYKAYASISDVKDSVDIAIICIPAKFVLDVVKECVKLEIKGLIIISAGFKEVGGQGALYEKELKEISQQHEIRIIGPNCLGIVSPYYNGTFSAISPKKGNIAVVSQSGAMLTAILDWAETQDMGFSNFISMGNKVDVDETDLIEELANDPDTKIILLYLESVNDGQKFLKIVPDAVHKKPVIILKSGISEAGSRAASSHTGALAGNDIAFSIAFEKCGVIRAKTMTDLFDMARIFDRASLPKGNHFVIVTNAGGPGIVATDAFEAYNVGLSRLSSRITELLRVRLPPEAAVYNPVDIIGDAPPERYRIALETVFQEENAICAGALILVTPQAQTKPLGVAQVLKEIQEKFPQKLIVASFMGGSSMVKPINHLQDSTIPCYEFPEQAIKAIKFICEYVENQKKPNINSKKIARYRISTERISEIFDNAQIDGRNVLLSSETSEIFRLYGIKNPKTYIAKSPSEAEKLSTKIGFPLVMKVVSPDIIHKTDCGGVILNVKDEQQARDAFVRIINNVQKYGPLNAKIYGIELQEMVQTESFKKSTQMILGMTRDPQWGPLLMVGTGGIYTNFLKDVSFDLAYKYDKEEAIAQLSKTKIYNILKGVRGEPPSDIEAILNVLVRISQLVHDFPQIVELDINPLLVFEESPEHDAYSAVDIKITIKQKKK